MKAKRPGGVLPSPVEVPSPPPIPPPAIEEPPPVVAPVVAPVVIHQQSRLLNLPAELRTHILSYVGNVKDKFAIRSVCKTLAQDVVDCYSWKQQSRVHLRFAEVCHSRLIIPFICRVYYE